ncbi:hypothetical protein JXC34_05435 [Candidatus Woesearchaeota archaeon]|nr:hypothetical protein [Candidatus Woesearchaeota archaeon]
MTTIRDPEFGTYLHMNLVNRLDNNLLDIRYIEDPDKDLGKVIIRLCENIDPDKDLGKVIIRLCENISPSQEHMTVERVAKDLAEYMNIENNKDKPSEERRLSYVANSHLSISGGVEKYWYVQHAGNPEPSYKVMMVRKKDKTEIRIISKADKLKEFPEYYHSKTLEGRIHRTRDEAQEIVSKWATQHDLPLPIVREALDENDEIYLAVSLSPDIPKEKKDQIKRFEQTTYHSPTTDLRIPVRFSYIPSVDILPVYGPPVQVE